MSGEKKTFMVQLRGVAPWVSAVSYEKDEQNLKLFFQLKEGTLSPEDIVVQEDGGPETIVPNPREQREVALPLALLPLSREELGLLGGKSELPGLCRRLAERLPALPGACIVFPISGTSFQGVLWGGNQELRARCKHAYSCQEKGSWLLCDITASSLEEAAQRISELSAP